MSHYLSGKTSQIYNHAHQISAETIIQEQVKPAPRLSGQLLCLISDERLLEMKKACAADGDVDRLKNILAYEQLLTKYSARNDAS